MKKTKKIEPSFDTFNPRDYLKEYYSKIGFENEELLKFFISAYKDIPKDSVLLEFSGGPTIYPLITASNNVKEIHFSDYLATNLDEIKKWQMNSPDAFNWETFFQRALELEGIQPSRKEVDKREMILRKKLTKFYHCDAFKKDPIDHNLRKYFDIINLNFVIESITSSKKTWAKLLSNVCSMLKKDGTLIMTAIKDTKYYHVGKKKFPAVSVSEEDVRKLLNKLGFNESTSLMYSIPAEITYESHKSYTGYKGMILIRATKN